MNAEPLNEDQIERRVEKAMDRLDARLGRGQVQNRRRVARERTPAMTESKIAICRMPSGLHSGGCPTCGCEPLGEVDLETARSTLATYGADPLKNRLQAASEGWGIFERGGDGMLVIDADDDALAFPNGIAAYDFVQKKAAEGSAYHQAALILHGTKGPD